MELVALARLLLVQLVLREGIALSVRGSLPLVAVVA